MNSGGKIWTQEGKFELRSQIWTNWVIKWVSEQTKTKGGGGGIVHSCINE